MNGSRRRLGTGWGSFQKRPRSPISRRLTACLAGCAGSHCAPAGAVARLGTLGQEVGRSKRLVRPLQDAGGTGGTRFASRHPDGLGVMQAALMHRVMVGPGAFESGVRKEPPPEAAVFTGLRHYDCLRQAVNMAAGCQIAPPLPVSREMRCLARKRATGFGRTDLSLRGRTHLLHPVPRLQPLTWPFASLCSSDASSYMSGRVSTLHTQEWWASSMLAFKTRGSLATSQKYAM